MNKENSMTTPNEISRLADEVLISTATGSLELVAEKAVKLAKSVKAAAPVAAQAQRLGRRDQTQSGVGAWCAPGPALEQQRTFILRFEDADRRDVLFKDEDEAYQKFADSELMGWNCHLFAQMPRQRVSPHAQQPASGAGGSDTERVLIDGTAYQVPAAVAGELLRLHLELHAAAQPQPSWHAMPERDPAKPAEQQGLFRKFDVRRTDGSDAPGGKHHGCRYFVLDVDHDRHAAAALTAYSAACEATHPALASDLREKWGAAQPPGNAAPDDAMERALAELVDKIVPGLDTGDLVADAATASKALSAQSSGDVGELPTGMQPIETIQYWAAAYADPKSGDHFMGHGMVVNMLREYAALRAALAAQAETPVDDKAHPRFQAGYAAGMKDHLLNAKTDDQLGGLLAAIQYFGTTKWEEGKGIAPPNLITVRKAWDEVYEKVQELAAQASGQDNFYAAVNAVILDLLDAETAEQIMTAIDARAAAKEQS